MKVSFFETGRYVVPPGTPREWPVPSGAYDPEAGLRAYRAMIERLRYVEDIGFDWISLSEHHYSPRILTPSPIVAAANVAALVRSIRIALLGPIVPQANPVRLAEELAMVDTMAGGRLVVGLLRGTTNEVLTYDLNPAEARQRTDEGMELILKAWTEPEPFGWQGRYFKYRTVSIWPRPLQQPHPPTYALGTSAEAGEFAARHRLGLGVSYGPFAAMAKSTGHYRERCAHYGWQPGPDHIVYRANMLLAESDAKAEARFEEQKGQAPFPVRAGLKEALIEADRRNIAGEKRVANVGGVLPTTFLGGPDTVIEQIRRCREEVGAGVIDLSLHPPGSGELDALMEAIDLFGRRVLPHIRDI
jgi:alkanesulfonate monooxygenase SsuD/methylene tetrahydromethanopterin reductase-like flavin-dependent oxidoreductase (luciferase family)